MTQIAVHRALTAEDGLKQTKTRRSVRIVAMVEPFGMRLWALHVAPDAPVCEVSVKTLPMRWKALFQPVTSKHAR